MNELVIAKGNELYTNSLIIANGISRKHDSITKAIKRYETDLNELGKVRLVVQPSKSGQNQNVYILNETQSVFLITLMDNSPKVIEFKKKLSIEFVTMRQFILGKQFAEWKQSRLTGKKTRLNETDVIRDKLIPLAISQGSKNSAKMYMTYSKLINSLLGIQHDQRDNLPLSYIDAIRFMENSIENLISLEVDKGTEYHEIFQVCKAKCGIIKELSFLPAPLKLDVA